MASRGIDWREPTPGQVVVGRGMDLRWLAERATEVLLIVWWVSFAAGALLVIDVEANVEEAAKATAQGRISNQILVLTLALLGTLHLRPALASLRASSCASVLVCLGLYLTWVQASVFWSEDPALSIRRLVSLACILIGVFGIGAGFYGRKRDGVLVLARHVLYAALISFAIAALSRLSATSWDEVLDPQWTLKSELPVFHFAYHCGFAAVAAIALAFAGRRRFQALAALCVFCLVVLKSRTLLISTTALCAMTYAYLSASAWVRYVHAMIAIVLLSFLVNLSTGGVALQTIITETKPTVDRFVPYLTISAGEDNIFELSGRRPLWSAVAREIERRPLLGHGFGAFWAPRQLREIQAKVGWPAVHAHNGFLDEVLATGLIGLGLFLAFWGSAIYSSLKLARGRHRIAGGLVAIWMFAFLCFNAMDTVMQIFFQVPTLLALTGLAALWGSVAQVGAPSQTGWVQ